MTKVTKRSVNYREAKGTRHCGSCAMFDYKQGSCDLVSGIIKAEAVCDRWVKKN